MSECTKAPRWFKLIVFAILAPVLTSSVFQDSSISEIPAWGKFVIVTSGLAVAWILTNAMEAAIERLAR